MKNVLFLLLLFMHTAAHAQYQGSNVNAVRADVFRHIVVDKATGVHEGWFDYISVMATDTAIARYQTIYDDSTIVVYDSSNAGYRAVHDYGAGFSFDPYSKVWDSAFVNIDYIPGFTLSRNMGYTADSLFIAGRYRRKAYNNYTDTLFVEIASTVSTAAFSVYDGPDTMWKDRSSDSTLRYFDVVYDTDNNRLSDSVYYPLYNFMRFGILLDAAFYADSLTDGSHSKAFKIPWGGIAVPANHGLVAYLHYKSGHVYAAGMPADSVNAWQQLYYELNGPGSTPYQVAGERNAGLVATNAARYMPYFTYQGHRMLLPTLYAEPAATNDWPYFAFYLRAEPTVIQEKSKIIANVRAYPNPADETVNISVTATGNHAVTVSLVDMQGQAVLVKKGTDARQQNIVLPVANIPAGAYHYTVQVGSAQQAGSIVVQH